MSPRTDDVAGIYMKGRALSLGDPDGRAFEPPLVLTVQAARAFKGGFIVRFEDVSDRNAAEVLRGRTLLIPFSEARALEPGEYFLHDLVDLEVRTVAGEAVGRVTDVYEVGPGHYLGVSDGEQELLIPFTQQIVRDVDLTTGTILIDPIPGLLSL